MQNINEYINEARLTSQQIQQIENLEKAASDTICINLAFIDVFTNILKNTKENSVELMFNVSHDVSNYNDKVPPIFKKYSGGSTTNITVGDWNSMVVYYIYPNYRKNYPKLDEIKKELQEQITNGVNNPYSGFGTTYSKKSLEQLYDIIKNKLSDNELKNIIKELKTEISDIKKKYKEEIDIMKNIK